MECRRRGVSRVAGLTGAVPAEYGCCGITAVRVALRDASFINKGGVIMKDYNLIVWFIRRSRTPNRPALTPKAIFRRRFKTAEKAVEYAKRASKSCYVYTAMGFSRRFGSRDEWNFWNKLKAVLPEYSDIYSLPYRHPMDTIRNLINRFEPSSADELAALFE